MEKEVNTLPGTVIGPNCDETSDIVEFYAGCNVLITGGSGFLGKLLVEKLLRSCPGINKMYLVMRAKKGKTPAERYKEHFEDPVYERLKLEQPEFASKVVMVEGQLGEVDWKMSSEDRELLKNSHVVFHSAASVRFDEKLRIAVNINVRGTKEILLLAREMPRLKAFIHIGTAFSHCVSKTIDEVFYDPPLGCDELLTMVDILDDTVLENVTPVILSKWPNTYAFTKTVAEDVVRKYCGELPLCIVRPSIMIATDREPVPGWINNLYGPTGVVFGAGIGFLHTLHCNSAYVADIIPADYVINNTIAAAWDIGEQHSIAKASVELRTQEEASQPELKRMIEPPIYNCVSSCQNPITWGEFMKFNEITGMKAPSMMAIWYYFFTLNKYLWVHNIYIVFTHLLPAIIGDTVARLTGREPILWSTYEKIHKFSGVISYFCTQQWQFRNQNVLKLWDKLRLVDREIFFFNVSYIDWPEYYMKHIIGLRTYVVKDPIETIDAAVIRYRKLKYAHYSLVTLMSILGLWLGYYVVHFFIPIISYILTL